MLQPWWRAAFPWPASPSEGMPHISGPRSDNLVNLRAAASTCSCARTLPAGRGRGILQCLCCCWAVPGTAVWWYLSWLLSPQPLLICQKCKYRKLGFRSWSCQRAKENASTVCKSFARLTAVRALTPLGEVYKTSSIQIFFICSWALDGDQANCQLCTNICHPNDSISKIPEKSQFLVSDTGIQCSPAECQALRVQAPMEKPSFFRDWRITTSVTHRILIKHWSSSLTEAERLFLEIHC